MLDRIARIQEMEAHLNRVSAVLRQPDADLSALLAVQDSAAVLSAYYSSPLWREDFEADEAGLLPRDLPRGVLSEDVLYDLLAENDERLGRSGQETELSPPDTPASEKD